MSLSVVIITFNEEANIGRTLESVSALVKANGEIVIVDSGSTDRTLEIAKSYGARVFVEPWKGYPAQKNSAIEKAGGDWILLLDADEEVSPELYQELAIVSGLKPLRHPRHPETTSVEKRFLGSMKSHSGLPAFDDAYWIPRKNFFLLRWIKHGGFYPDLKLRLFRRGVAKVEDRTVHETIQFSGLTGQLKGDLLHYAYPTLSGYIEHMNKYSSLGAQMAVQEGKRGFSFINVILRPWFTFFYNYFLRLGFLDGKEGLLLHFYHAVYVSWKYAKVWELSKTTDSPRRR